MGEEKDWIGNTELASMFFIIHEADLQLLEGAGEKLVEKKMLTKNPHKTGIFKVFSSGQTIFSGNNVLHLFRNLISLFFAS